MFSKETVLNKCYQELSDVLMDVLKYEFAGLDIECSVIHILNKMIDDCQLMIDNVDSYEWSDIMKVNQSYYQTVRLVNVLLINQYDKIFSHKH